MNKSETPEISKEVLKEFIGESFGGKSSKVYHEEIVNQFISKNTFLSDIKGILSFYVLVKESELIAKNEESRENFITLYKQQLEALIATG